MLLSEQRSIFKGEKMSDKKRNTKEIGRVNSNVGRKFSKRRFSKENFSAKVDYK